MNRKLLALALACTALALPACGDDDDESSSDTGPAPSTQAAPPSDTTTQEDSGGASGGGGSQLEADADPSGQFTITMKNASDLPHAIEVEGPGVEEEGETVEKGGTSKVTAELKPGEYEFYCPVPGHKEGGMKGTLTVK
jgi:plastocyanin